MPAFSSRHKREAVWGGCRGGPFLELVAQHAGCGQQMQCHQLVQHQMRFQ